MYDIRYSKHREKCMEQCGRAQPTVAGSIPGQAVLSYLRKQAEQAGGARKRVLHSLCFSSCPDFLPVRMDYDL